MTLTPAEIMSASIMYINLILNRQMIILYLRRSKNDIQYIRYG